LKERLITLLTALIALGVVIVLFAPQHAHDQNLISLPTSEDAGENGLKGLSVWLQREGLATASLRKRYSDLELDNSLSAQGNVLLLSLPAPMPVAEAEWAALSRWLDKGNTLIILGAVYQHPVWMKESDCFCDVKTFLARYHWQLNNDSAENKPPLHGATPETEPETAPSLKQSLEKFQQDVKQHLPQDTHLSAQKIPVLLAGVNTLDTKIRPDLLNSPWRLTNDDQQNLALKLLTEPTQNLPVSWLINTGQGRIILMLTADIFDNSHLNHADNALFFNQLLNSSQAAEGRLLFDDYHFGLSDLYDPQHFFNDTRLHKTLAAIAVFWMFYLIGYTSRLAPVQAVVDKLSTQDFIQVGADFFARRLNKTVLAQALLQHLLADIHYQRRLQNETEVWRWLEQHSQISRADLQLLKQVQLQQRVSLQQLTNTLIHIRIVTL
jgi:hypothetical protein